MADSSNTGEILLAFLVGGLVGTAVGLLYAPRPGKETRQRLKGLTEDISERIKTMSEDVKERAEHAVSEAKEKIFHHKCETE